MLDHWMNLKHTNDASLAGHMLVATPAVQDACFGRSVILLCAHSREGAMGMIINRPLTTVPLKAIFEQLNISTGAAMPDLPLHFGGPVEPYRGFILHGADQPTPDALFAKDGIAVSASVNILQKLALGEGPRQGMLVLGYAGWAAKQLESEIESGSWLAVPASKSLIFDTDNANKWNAAVSTLGFDMGHFSTQVGHA